MSYSFDTVAPVYDFVMPLHRPREFLSLLDPQPGEAILEVGAGTGRIAQFYADSPEDCVLVDPSPRMLERARRKVPRAHPVVGRAEELQFAEGSFDKVISYDSLHHWDDQPRGLREIRRVLKKGGLLVVVEVNPRTFWGHKVALMEKLLRMRSHFHPPEALVDLARSAGLQKVNIKSVGDGFTYGLVCNK